MRRSLVVSLSLLAIVGSQAAAQTCQGSASFSTGPVQVAGQAQFPTGATIWGGSLSYGLPSGLYAGADLSNTSIENNGGNSLGIGAHAGYQMTVGRTAKVAVCPVAHASLGMGPDDKAANINGSSTDLGFGLALGKEMGATQQMRIIPTAGLALQYNKVKVEDTAPGGSSAQASETYGLARLGMGFVFNQQISVRPTVDIPLGSNLNTDPTFGVSVGYNFGSKSVSRGRRH